MRHEFKLQDPGEGVHEVEIQEVLVAQGDTVAEGDDVLVVESDKAAIDLPSPYSGQVAEIRVAEGDVTEVGDVLMVIEEEGETGDDAASEAAEPGLTEADDAPEVGATTSEPDTHSETGSGETRSKSPADTGDQPGRKSGGGDAAAPIRATPAARKLAEEEDIDLAGIEPSGGEGQIVTADVRAAAEHREPAGQDERHTGDRDGFGPVERVRLRSVRAATARTMARSWAEIPHAVHQDLADITDLESWRRSLAEEDGNGDLTFTPFAVKAVAAVLRDHPRFNARLDAEAGEIELRRYYNINVAVATERGLLTPVLRGVDGKPVRTLAGELAELAARMRDGRPSRADLSGGTFTLTNVGALGGTAFSPIINPPQSAILGLGAARLMPVVQGDPDDLDAARTTIRLMLPVVVAFDHRLIDGAEAARFVNDFAARLGDVESFTLDV